MKILHTSDWHLGASEQNTSLKEDQEFFINQIADIVKANDIEVVIIAGDVYDKSLASAEAIHLYDAAMEKLCVELGKKVIIVAGNHDSSDRLANCSALLKKAGLYICGALEKEPVIVREKDVNFYLLPWFTEEKVKTLFPEKRDEINDIKDAFETVLDECRKTFENGKKNIAVSHAFIANSETSTSDRAAVIGYASQVPVSVFEGFDYVALGHIHKSQDVGENARYCGTPMPYSFGKEEKQEKSVTVINTADMSREIIPLKLLHKRKTISGTFEDVLNYSCIPEEKNGYIRVEISDISLGLEAITRLSMVYPNVLSWQGKSFDGDGTTSRMSMEEFIQMESNPEEIFKSFCRDVVKEEASEHLIEMFRQSLTEE